MEIRSDHKNWSKWGFKLKNLTICYPYQERDYVTKWCHKLAMALCKMNPSQEKINELLNMFHLTKHARKRYLTETRYEFFTRFTTKITTKNIIIQCLLLYFPDTDFENNSDFSYWFGLICNNSFMKWMKKNTSIERILFLIQNKNLFFDRLSHHEWFSILNKNQVESIKSNIWKHDYDVMMGDQLLMKPFDMQPGVYTLDQDLIGYKVLSLNALYSLFLIATVLIPKNSTIVVTKEKKLRCNQYKIIKIEDKKGNYYDSGIGPFLKQLYQVNHIYEVNDLNINIDHVCVSGLHFFGNFHEAVQYLYSKDIIALCL